MTFESVGECLHLFNKKCVTQSRLANDLHYAMQFMDLPIQNMETTNQLGCLRNYGSETLF
jgi:hypothetical protein